MRPEPGLVRAVERVGDRWVLLIVAGLLDGPRRFGDLGDGLGVAPNILTARLRQLTEDGLVVARPYSHRPVRHEYALTGAGRELAATLAQLADWGSRRRGGPPLRRLPLPLRHHPRGAALVPHLRPDRRGRGGHRHLRGLTPGHLPTPGWRAGSAVQSDAARTSATADHRSAVGGSPRKLDRTRPSGPTIRSMGTASTP